MAGIILAPVVATFASVAPPVYLGLLGKSQEAYNDFKAGCEDPLPPYGGLLKALGALLLFAGHFTLGTTKARLARCDFCYLVGVVNLFVLFGAIVLHYLLHRRPPPLRLGCVEG